MRDTHCLEAAKKSLGFAAGKRDPWVSQCAWTTSSELVVPQIKEGVDGPITTWGDLLMQCEKKGVVDYSISHHTFETADGERPIASRGDSCPLHLQRHARIISLDSLRMLSIFVLANLCIILFTNINCVHELSAMQHLLFSGATSFQVRDEKHDLPLCEDEAAVAQHIKALECGVVHAIRSIGEFPGFDEDLARWLL